MDPSSKSNLLLLGLVMVVVFGMALTNNLNVPTGLVGNGQSSGLSDQINTPRGSNSPISRGGNMLSSGSNTGGTQVYGTGNRTSQSNNGQTAPQDINLSPWYGKVTITRAAARGRDLLSEYLTIRLSSRSEEPVTITGWKIRSVPQFAEQVDDDEIEVPESEIKEIPKGSTLIRTGIVGIPLSPIVLEPGESAHLISGGPSYQNDPIPILWSFKTSKCTGYFARDFRLRPSLNTRQCPEPLDYFSTFELTNECYDYIRFLGRCENPEETRSSSFSRLPKTCRDQIEEYFSYNACLREHRKDEDFLGDEWYVFLDRNQEFYPDRRNWIQIFDSKGLLVDEVRY